MSDYSQDYKEISPDDYLSQGTVSRDFDRKPIDYSESIDDKKMLDMKEYPMKKTSFSKIRYVQKQS